LDVTSCCLVDILRMIRRNILTPSSGSTRLKKHFLLISCKQQLHFRASHSRKLHEGHSKSNAQYFFKNSIFILDLYYLYSMLIQPSETKYHFST
jgi:hypothetical protein